MTFTVEVANPSVEAVNLTSLTDDVFGDLLSAARIHCCRRTPAPLRRRASRSEAR